MDFGRLITAMVTPFDANLQVDEAMFLRVMDHLIEEQKCEGLVICGTTGESPTLSEDEKLRLFELAVQHNKGRCKIIAGTGSNDTAESIRMTQKATAIGVDGIMLVAPYYNRPSQEGLYQHFKAIAQSTELPIMLYNVPARTSVTVAVETTLKLAQLSNVVASKEAHNDMEHVTALIANAPDHFRVYCGDDSMTLPFLSVGAHGIVSVAAHLIGSRMSEMIKVYLQGDVTGAARLHQQLFPTFKGVFECPHRVPSPAPVKHGLKLRGFDVGGVRLPLVAVTEEEGRFIENLLK